MQSTDKLCFNGKSDIAKIVSEQLIVLADEHNHPKPPHFRRG
jgi:hypothetical protein